MDFANMEIKDQVSLHSYHTAVRPGKEQHRYTLSFDKVTYDLNEVHLSVQHFWYHP